MSAHATIEELSAYLDRELPAAELDRVEAHLEACSECRTRCQGMDKVVAGLRHLRRMAPPSTLDLVTVRRIALAAERPSLSDRLEEGLGSFQRQSSILSLFCLVIALAVIMLLFSHALERSATIPVTFKDPEFLHVTTGEDGRRLQHADGVWIEVGVDPTAPRRTIAADSDAGRELLAHHPELAALAGLDAPVVIAVDGEIVELR